MSKIRAQADKDIEVDRYCSDDETGRTWWIVVGDAATRRDVADDLARAALRPGEDLEYHSRDDECGGPVYMVVPAAAEVAS